VLKGDIFVNKRKKKKIINRNGFHKYINYKLYKAIDEFCIDKYGKEVYDQFNEQNTSANYKKNTMFVTYDKKMDYKHIHDVLLFWDVFPGSVAVGSEYDKHNPKIKIDFWLDTSGELNL
jgi:hypothetical protein